MGTQTHPHTAASAAGADMDTCPAAAQVCEGTETDLLNCDVFASSTMSCIAAEHFLQHLHGCCMSGPICMHGMLAARQSPSEDGASLNLSYGVRTSRCKIAAKWCAGAQRSRHLRSLSQNSTERRLSFQIHVRHEVNTMRRLRARTRRHRRKWTSACSRGVPPLAMLQTRTVFCVVTD